MDVEIVRLDGERLLDLEFVCRVVHVELEVLEHGDKSELCLLPCEWTALRIDRVESIRWVLWCEWHRLTMHARIPKPNGCHALGCRCGWCEQNFALS